MSYGAVYDVVFPQKYALNFVVLITVESDSIGRHFSSDVTVLEHKWLDAFMNHAISIQPIFSIIDVTNAGLI